MEIDPATLDVPSRYKLLIGGVVPRPIALVSTVSPSGALNLAPFSFFSGVGSDPMSLLFCPSNTPQGHDKDTLRNIEATGQFVVNVVSAALARQAATCAEALPHEASEFELAGLSPAPSRVVKPPRTAESPVSFECEKTHVLRLNPGAAGGGNVVVGRVVWVHVADAALEGAGRINPEALDAVGRMGGLTYCTTRDRFELPTGKAALVDAGQ